MTYNGKDWDELLRLLGLLKAVHLIVNSMNALKEQEERRTSVRKRRLETLGQRWANESESSSDDDCEEKTNYTGLQKIFDTAQDNHKEQAVMTKQQCKPVHEMKISNRRTFKRRKLSSIINGKFVESIVSKFSDKQFKQHFRVSRKTMDKLQERFKNSTEYQNIFKLDSEAKVPVDYYMIMFLWFAGKKCSYLELSNMFSVSLSTSVCIVDTVLQFLYNSGREYVRFPETPSDKRTCAENFQEIAGFPDVLGCLVNTLIQVQIPLEESNKSNSSHENMTFTIQAICDYKGRFFDVFVDPTHKVHHTDMLQASPIKDKLKEICQGRYHLLADGEYHVREWLLTPYKTPLSPGQEFYNQKHHSTLQGVLDSLEHLKSRFQQLTNMPLFSTHKIRKMIIACCVLQNICLDDDDCYDIDDPLAIFPSQGEEEEIVVGKEIVDDTHLRRIGELKRKQVMEDLKML